MSKSKVELFSEETPVLVQLLMQRSSDSVEDVCEHLAASSTVAEFLVDYIQTPEGESSNGK